MKKHQSEVLPSFSSNWTRRVVRLSTWPQLTSSERVRDQGKDDDSGHFCNCHNVVFIPPLPTPCPSCQRSSIFLASIFFTIFTARAFWRLRLFFSSSFISCCSSLVLLFALLIVQTWHYCFLRPTRLEEENTTSTAAKPGQKTEKGSLLSQQFALVLIAGLLPLSVSVSLSLSLLPYCAIVCEYAKLKLAATATL